MARFKPNSNSKEPGWWRWRCRAAVVFTVIAANTATTQVQEVWRTVYEGAGDSQFSLTATVAVDEAGFGYVLGYVRPAAREDYDFITVKCDPSGRLLWTEQYDGPRHAHDLPTELAVDASGNVCVV